MVFEAGYGLSSGSQECILGDTNIVEVLLKLKKLPYFEVTWEKFSAINQSFPIFHLDKVVVGDSGEYCKEPPKPPISCTYAMMKLRANN